MEEIILDAEPREELGKGKVKALRTGGFIPAVVYREGKESLAIKVSHKKFLQLIHEYRSENLIVNLQIKDDKKSKNRSCLVKEIQHDPVNSEILHIDFNEISLTKAIKVNVPVTAKGEPIGVKQEGGSLDHILWEIEVECLPTEIPKAIDVDVSNLKIGDAVHIKEIAFPANIKVLTDPESVVLSVSAPVKEEVVVAAPEGEVAQEPEVIKEKKETAEEGQPEEAKEEKKEKDKQK